MRQLLVQVPRGCGQQAFDIAKACNGTNLTQLEAIGNDGLLDVVVVHVSNGKVEELLEKLEALPNLHVTLLPRGVIALQPPTSEASQQVKDVEVRSPIEIFLSGLQSVGSWKGFLGYAAAAGVVVWIGLFTNTSYLLVAAMLIAPFAGPAMNAAIATARGDGKLLRRSLYRYFAALAVTIVVAGTLSLIMQQKVVTSSMNATSTVSAVAVLLPLVAGAAGALNANLVYWSTRMGKHPDRLLIPCRLKREQPCVASTQLQQLLVSPLLHDFSLCHNDNSVSHPHGREPMRN
jgi:hypothetical protein